MSDKINKNYCKDKEHTRLYFKDGTEICMDCLCQKTREEQVKQFDNFIKKDLGTMKELVKECGIFSKIVAKYMRWKKEYCR